MKILNDYYSNPNYCKYCKKVIPLKKDLPIYETKRKSFCNSSCAASFNNKDKIRVKKQNLNTICSCGKKKCFKAKMCKDCRKKDSSIENKTLGFYISDKKYLSSKLLEVRKHSRKVLNNSLQEKVCKYCFNHEFDEILEVHHIKSILDFSLQTLIKDINNETNLVWLCPNHHLMIEKKLISL